MTQKTTKTAVPDAEKESPGIGSILLRMILLMAVIRFFAAFPTPDKLILLIVLILGPGRSSLKFFLTFSVGCAFLFIKWLKETLEELRETAALAADKVSHDAEVAANFLKTDSQNLKKALLRRPQRHPRHRCNLSLNRFKRSLSVMKMHASWLKSGGAVPMRTERPAKCG